MSSGLVSFTRACGRGPSDHQLTAVLFTFISASIELTVLLKRLVESVLFQKIGYLKGLWTPPMNWLKSSFQRRKTPTSSTPPLNF